MPQVSSGQGRRDAQRCTEWAQRLTHLQMALLLRLGNHELGQLSVRPLKVKDKLWGKATVRPRWIWEVLIKSSTVSPPSA